MKQKIQTSAGLSFALLLGACGGGGGGSTSTIASTGILLDSAVAGIGYRTATQAGVTNAKGEYNFLPGEKVLFSIGNIQFPEVVATAVVTPLDIAQTTDTNNQIVSNILVLLQSLDEDGNPSNGIAIPSMASGKAKNPVAFDVSPLAFSSNTAVVGLVADSGSITKSLVSPANAIQHFETTLTTRNIPYTSAPTFKKTASIAVPEPISANCPQGGSKIQSGIDTNGNGVLDSSEVTSTSYVCNGATGAAGLAALINVVAEPAGSNCASGGSRIQAGVDSNGNKLLDGSEVTSNSFVCHGATGPAGATGASGFNSLVKVTPEPAGPNCASGGNKIQTGLDSNRDGILGVDEIASTQYTCNGSFPSSYDITPPTITTTAPLVASGYSTTVTATYADDTELAIIRSGDSGLTVIPSGIKTQQVEDVVTLPLGSSATKTYMAIDMAGNTTKKTFTILTPATILRLGQYRPVTAYNLPAGFNCSYSSAYPFYLGATDGSAVLNSYLQDVYFSFGGGSSGTVFPGGSAISGAPLIYNGWSAVSGYAPGFSAYSSSGSIGGQSSALVALSATTFGFESAGGSVSGSGSFGTFSVTTAYAGTVTMSSVDPTIVNVNIAMKCNINNTGIITGTAASFDMRYITVPIASAGNSQSVGLGTFVNLFGQVATNSQRTISYRWVLTSKPSGSQAALSSVTVSNPTFTADIAGAYVATLVVNDGIADSAPSTVTITAQ